MSTDQLKYFAKEIKSPVTSPEELTSVFLEYHSYSDLVVQLIGNLTEHLPDRGLFLNQQESGEQPTLAVNSEWSTHIAREAQETLPLRRPQKCITS